MTEDRQLVRRIVTHPKIWPWMVEDGASPENFDPVIHEKIHYVLALDGRVPLALFMFEPRTSVKYNIHMAIIPSQWPRAVEAICGVIRWAWDRIPGCARIAGEIPADNRHTLRLAKKAGFEMVGTEAEAFLRRGKLQDVRIVGVSKSRKDHSTCQ